jgi:hypothetical protein
MIDSHKLQNINKIFDKNRPPIDPNDPLKTQENYLITLSSVPEREQEKEKEEDLKRQSNQFFILNADIFVLENLADFKLDINVPEFKFENLITNNKTKHGRNYSLASNNLHKKHETFIMNNDKIHETEKYMNSPTVQDNLNKSGFGDRSVVNACLICFDKSPDSVFMDCGHGGTRIAFFLYY